jgi:hypothetical protein
MLLKIGNIHIQFKMFLQFPRNFQSLTHAGALHASHLKRIWVQIL